MMVIAMLMAVVLALSHYQGIARQTYMAEEAGLRFREGLRYEQRRLCLNMPSPGDLLVTAVTTNVTTAGTPVMGPLMSAKIFDRTNGLPDLKNVDKTASHDTLKFTPTTPDVGLRVFGKNTYTTVMTAVPGYAAYAPAGNIKIVNMEGWANPPFGDPRNSVEAYSGVKAVATALKNVSVANVTYGEAHTVDGKATVDLGNGVAFKNKKFPLRQYQAALLTVIKDARNQLQTNATSSGDKTGSLVSKSTGPAAIINLFFGGGQGLEEFLSLRNANHFWMPMIPSFSPSPPYLYQFAFSIPWPPDNANYSSAEGVEKQLNDIGKELETAGKELDAAKKAMDQAEANYNANKSVANLTAWQNTITVWNNAKAKVENLTQQMNAVAGPQKAQIDAQSSAGMKGVPPTRAQDPSGNNGQPTWNYSMAGSLLANLVSFLFSFDPQKLAATCSNPDVKLIHFGGKDRDYQFVLDESNMTLDATLTVPRGRTLRLASPGTILVAGDLWLQRGSTFVADCSKLRVAPGRGSDPNKFFSPGGRIFMEEGSTLICPTGEIECVGSSKWGSVIVGGVPGKIHPLTAGIFGRKVTLNSGVFAGTALDDLLEGLGITEPTLKSINDDLMRPLLSVIAPNAAKVLGPFWPRKPYFAQYATTFQIICPPIPPFGIPGPPIPTPIPLPSKNVLVPIARGLSYVYSVTLNLSLGENFYTHSDWWIFGEGVVPMVPQVDPSKVVSAISNFGSTALDALNPESLIKSFVDTAVNDMVTYVVKEVIVEVVKKVALSVIPYAGIVNMAGDLLSDAATNLTNRDSKRDSTGSSLTSSLTGAIGSNAKTTLANLAGKFSMDVENEFLREYNGVLVYADETIDIGGNMATGFFVAGGNINVTSKQCVGALLSDKGDINCQTLLFYPYFNRASFYIPKATPNGWLERALEFKYDSGFSSDQAVDVGPPVIPQQVSAQGWFQ
ncbi:hypothetical protein IV102_06000 [bacterium]|nr:hypothetical protein [bacterium]